MAHGEAKGNTTGANLGFKAEDWRVAGSSAKFQERLVMK